MVVVPLSLALIDGIAALYISGQYLSVLGSIGFIALFGVAVLNGIMMLNAINQCLLGGGSAHEAVFEGALSRLRPVLMTASIAALGLIPMLRATGCRLRGATATGYRGAGRSGLQHPAGPAGPVGAVWGVFPRRVLFER
ncbi:AcrB/AcrD/AcrF family protein [endosymbiont of Ridgeia piscesae]|uniref:AcrB/AcrD/AcrF family protein n=1 Tax=endosymbiont of Ridgeia piscesae TaxID=54398 RepID=A0A0T5Z6S9_9GAMM|nr:efflux RND transporter permease subunit [endosymbiont of Ridgeia piscesae]KRT58495.1 AcrB/AcrD/AcrF family protein [endosymbiont of Ridgeia piscesae]